MLFKYLFISGLYPKDLKIQELSLNELSVKWTPPELFEHFELNYLVNVYEFDQNKVYVKKHEIVSQEPSCLLSDLNAMTTYKISVWPVLAKTQKKKGWPNHTKYIIQDVGKSHISSLYHDMKLYKCNFSLGGYLIPLHLYIKSR